MVDGYNLHWLDRLLSLCAPFDKLRAKGGDIAFVVSEDVWIREWDNSIQPAEVRTASDEREMPHVASVL